MALKIKLAPKSAKQKETNAYQLFLRFKKIKNKEKI